VLAVKDQFPPGLLRATYEGLSRAYEILGRTQEAEAARSRSGRLIAECWVSAGDGFRFVPQRLAELAPGVHVAQGYDFSDLAFVLTAEGIVAIDAASTPEHAAAALRDLREITRLPITHVILTHAHFDHIGGLGAPLPPTGATMIAQANFPGELQNQNSGPAPFRYLLPGGRSHRAQVAVDHLVSEPETLTIGGVAFMLIPIAGGETYDGLIIHLPDRDVVFTGNMTMPYLGAPFFAEGSAEGLFEAMETVMALHPRLLIHGHAGLTFGPLAPRPGTISTSPGPGEAAQSHGPGVLSLRPRRAPTSPPTSCGGRSLRFCVSWPSMIVRTHAANIGR
jgi:glyoxylase-like metal-dependent hydrolase (beta-lactamase superfamily II)